MPFVCATFNNSYIINQLDPRSGILRVGYIRGHYSKKLGSQQTGVGRTETIEKVPIKWGKKAKPNNYIAYTQTKELQEFFGDYGDFTITAMDIYFRWDIKNEEGKILTYIVILPFRTWSFKPSFSTKIFGEIPSANLREKIIKQLKKMNLPKEIKRRVRDTWLVSLSPITSIDPKYLDVKFYKFVLGKAAMITVHKETKQQFDGRVLK